MFSSVVLMRTETMSIGFKLMKFGLGFNYIFANETSWQKKNFFQGSYHKLLLKPISNQSCVHNILLFKFFSKRKFL